MSIMGIVGLPGHGKGSYAVRLMKQFIARRDRRTIYCNFPVNLPGVVKFDRFSQIYDVVSSIVFLDEAYKEFGSRTWNDKERGHQLSAWTQHRHSDLQMYWMAQSPSAIDLTIREHCTEYIYHVWRMTGPAENNGFTPLESWLKSPYSIVRKYAGFEFGKQKASPFKTEIIRLADTFGCFDTHFNIDVHAPGGGYTPVPVKDRQSKSADYIELPQARSKVFMSRDEYYSMCVRDDHEGAAVTRFAGYPEDVYEHGSEVVERLKSGELTICDQYGNPVRLDGGDDDEDMPGAGSPSNRRPVLGGPRTSGWRLVG